MIRNARLSLYIKRDKDGFFTCKKAAITEGREDDAHGVLVGF